MLPESAVALIRRARLRLRRMKVTVLPALTEEDFRSILVDALGLAEGDAVLIHSSIDHLNLAFPFGRILSLVRSVIGERGTMLFPTYPGVPSYEFLRRGDIFDVRKTPSYMGIVSEYARRQRDAVRSLHPTKSVCALGPLARELTAAHPSSPYPYDRCSPYYKLMEHSGKLVGLGVSTERNSFVHCVEDSLKDDFPVRTYHERLFAARCLNYAGETVVVETFAHDLQKLNHDIPRYVREYISREACRDLKIKGMRFFRADTAKLFAEMVRLATRGITIYPRADRAEELPEAEG